MSKILYSFATAFRRVPKAPDSLAEGAASAAASAAANAFGFTVAMDLKEDDGKGNFRYKLYLVSQAHEKNILK